MNGILKALMNVIAKNPALLEELVEGLLKMLVAELKGEPKA